jgi:hypothetical protein
MRPDQPIPGAQDRPVYLMAWTAATPIMVTLDGVQQQVRGETLFLWSAAKALYWLRS